VERLWPLAPSLHRYRSIPLRPLTGAISPRPSVLGSEAGYCRAVATNGEFLCSVKADTAISRACFPAWVLRLRAIPQRANVIFLQWMLGR
jgi:hypothetical protein